MERPAGDVAEPPHQGRVALEVGELRRVRDRHAGAARIDRLELRRAVGVEQLLPLGVPLGFERLDVEEVAAGLVGGELGLVQPAALGLELDRRRLLPRPQLLRRGDRAAQGHAGDGAVLVVAHVGDDPHPAVAVLGRHGQLAALRLAHDPVDELLPELAVHLRADPLLVPVLLLGVGLGAGVGGERDGLAEAVAPRRQQREPLVGVG